MLWCNRDKHDDNDGDDEKCILPFYLSVRFEWGGKIGADMVQQSYYKMGRWRKRRMQFKTIPGQRTLCDEMGTVYERRRWRRKMSYESLVDRFLFEKQENRQTLRNEATSKRYSK